MQWQPHITVAAVVERGGKFLLVEEETHEGRVYNQPAGHWEQEESIMEAIVRETREETAWRFRPVGLVGIYRWQVPSNGMTYLRFCFHGEVDDHRPEQPLDAGILRATWRTRDSLSEEQRLRSPMVLRCIDDYLAGHHFPLGILHDLD